MVVCPLQLVDAGKSARDQVFEREPVEDFEAVICYPTAILKFYAVSGPVLTIPRETADFICKAHIFLQHKRRAVRIRDGSWNAWPGIPRA